MGPGHQRRVRRRESSSSSDSASRREPASPWMDAGRSIQGYEGGYFVKPTILADVPRGSEISKTEIFGPVLSLMHVNTVDEAIELVNSGQYGNQASLFTSSGSAARKFRYEAEAGNIGINIGVAAPMAFFPFSGWKEFVLRRHAWAGHGCGRVLHSEENRSRTLAQRVDEKILNVCRGMSNASPLHENYMKILTTHYLIHHNGLTSSSRKHFLRRIKRSGSLKNPKITLLSISIVAGWNIASR